MNDKTEFRIKNYTTSLSRWCFNNILNQIPKTYSAYRLSIINCLNSLNENILRANLDNGNAKNRYQREALVQLGMLDQHLGSIYELKCIDNKKFMVMAKKINEVKKMIYGWIKPIEKVKSSLL